MFADDTRVTKYIRTEEGMESLQTDLDKIYQWQETNNMQFNGALLENIINGQYED